ncbi:MAG TPA: hypothetical protein VEA59_05035 [Patescibacteria group bacterium]|nr:hypothetical protein [Patescibacteria group bacterium]
MKINKLLAGLAVPAALLLTSPVAFAQSTSTPTGSVDAGGGGGSTPWVAVAAISLGAAGIVTLLTANKYAASFK